VLLGGLNNKLLDVRAALLASIMELNLVRREIAFNSTPNFLAICFTMVLWRKVCQPSLIIGHINETYLSDPD
jgi:hypothetical protein